MSAESQSSTCTALMGVHSETDCHTAHASSTSARSASSAHHWMDPDHPSGPASHASDTEENKKNNMTLPTSVYRKELINRRVVNSAPRR